MFVSFHSFLEITKSIGHLRVYILDCMLTRTLLSLQVLVDRLLDLAVVLLTTLSFVEFTLEVLNLTHQQLPMHPYGQSS